MFLHFASKIYDDFMRGGHLDSATTQNSQLCYKTINHRCTQMNADRRKSYHLSHLSVFIGIHLWLSY